MDMRYRPFAAAAPSESSGRSIRGDLGHRVTHPVFDGLEETVPVSVAHWDEESSLSDTSVESFDTAAVAAICAVADKRRGRERAHRDHGSRSHQHRCGHS